MSNNSYLRCIGEDVKNTKELYAENALPDGWAQLFAPEELHVGHPRENPKAPAVLKEGERETTSYLLCEAVVALPRFAERMRRVGVAVTGKGVTARFYAWLETNMSKGWWFADTTELEWMESSPGEGVAGMRSALASAQKAMKFHEPSAESFLLTFGWGTGLSAEEQKQKERRRAAKGEGKKLAAQRVKAAAAAQIAEARQAPVDVSTLEGRPFSIRESFELGEQVAHPVFKSGVVTAVTPTTITVEFPTGPQLLAHQRK